MGLFKAWSFFLHLSSSVATCSIFQFQNTKSGISRFSWMKYIEISYGMICIKLSITIAPGIRGVGRWYISLIPVLTMKNGSKTEINWVPTFDNESSFRFFVGYKLKIIYVLQAITQKFIQSSVSKSQKERQKVYGIHYSEFGIL